MIRNVVLGRMEPVEDPEQQAAIDARLDEALAGIAALDLPGQLAMSVGRDAGLRAGGWSFAVTNDWADEAAYRAYDVDAEHNRHRAVIVDLSAEVARVQFELP